MESYKKIMGLSLTVFFGAYSLNYLIIILSGILGLSEPKILNVIDLALYLGAAVALIVPAFKSEIPMLTKIASCFTACLCLVVFVNISAYLIGGSNLWGDYVNVYGVVMGVLYIIAMAVLLLPSKVWTPLKIVGSIAFIPGLITDCIFITIRKASEANDFEALTSLFDSVQTVSIISIVLYITSFIFALVWLNKKPIAPSMRNQTIDAI